MCYEHLRFLLYKLGAAEAGDLRYGRLFNKNYLISTIQQKTNNNE